MLNATLASRTPLVCHNASVKSAVFLIKNDKISGRGFDTMPNGHGKKTKYEADVAVGTCVAKHCSPETMEIDQDSNKD